MTKAAHKQIHFLKASMHFDEYNPHHFLGLHKNKRGQKVVRLWRPGASEAYLQLFDKIVKAKCVHPAGLFEYRAPAHTSFKDYKVYHHNGLLGYDPYSFFPSLGDLDLYLFSRGVHYQLYNVMGGRLVNHQGMEGVRFCVWAPNAKSVAVVGDFNHWDGRCNLMRSLGSSGLWELFVPGLKEGLKYKFEIRSQGNDLHLKADPMALCGEMRPANASIIANVDKFIWEDAKWMEKRQAEASQPKPIHIYEVHLGSWKKKEGWRFMNYREIAPELASYCQEMGYTHVELLPIQEHPLDESWGYQVSGYYAVTSRFGSPEDFQWFVNHMHENNIGVILDWVPGHFPIDNFSLGRFDGTALYEHEDYKQGYHPHWNTYIFNFGRKEVVNFLIANALFWFDKMHVDGLRVDAVASMLYLDYGREEGQWIANQFGGNENLEAIEFMKHLNSIVHKNHPGVLMIAEESTSFPKVTHPVEDGGLGFDIKWNMGWMNDTLDYIAKDSIYRQHHHHNLTFGLLYAFSEKFILVLSHDEVVHGKRSLLSKMPGDMWQQFANLRLLLSYMMCQPGKKLLFMGGEIGQWNEWSSTGQIEWPLLQFPLHQGLKKMNRDLNHFYLQNCSLWERDNDPAGFEWVDFEDRHNSVICYLRKSLHDILLCVHNFTPNYYSDYRVNLKNLASVKEVFNTDDVKYGGSGKLNSYPEILTDSHGKASALKIHLAPLSTMILRVTFW